MGDAGLRRITMQNLISSSTIILPDWVSGVIERWPEKPGTDPETLMGYCLELLNYHIDHKTGGPFASLVIDGSDGTLISVGVNLVVRASDCSAHGEVVAIRLASAKLDTYNLPTRSILVTSAQMCGMCHNALIWSGIGTVIIGARATDVEEITGFDEGDIPDDWISRLEKRGIRVLTDVLRPQSIEAYKRYVKEGGQIYNGTRD
jgi:tRNA(Arg) A34 adenosine deaminase TadA